MNRWKVTIKTFTCYVLYLPSSSFMEHKTENPQLCILTISRWCFRNEQELRTYFCMSFFQEKNMTEESIHLNLMSDYIRKKYLWKRIPLFPCLNSNGLYSFCLPFVWFLRHCRKVCNEWNLCDKYKP